MQLLVTLTELPPSQIEVLRILAQDESLKSSNEIISQAKYSQRAVRNALKSLLAMGVIEKHPYLPDTRQSRYKLTLDLESLRTVIQNQLDLLKR